MCERISSQKTSKLTVGTLFARILSQKYTNFFMHSFSVHLRYNSSIKNGHTCQPNVLMCRIIDSNDSIMIL